MIAAAVEEMYNLEEENRFLEVTYANGDKEVLYFKDFSSGAMIESVVRGPRSSPSSGTSRRAPRASTSRMSSTPSVRSSRRTRTSPTRPTPTTGSATGSAHHHSGSTGKHRCQRQR
jgi:hypothetical protein